MMLSLTKPTESAAKVDHKNVFLPQFHHSVRGLQTTYSLMYHPMADYKTLPNDINIKTPEVRTIMLYIDSTSNKINTYQAFLHNVILHKRIEISSYYAE